MYELSQVLLGVKKFVERDFIARVEDPMKKVLIGGCLGLYLRRGAQLVEQYRDLPLIKSLDIINENNQINVDVLYDEFKPRIKETPVKFDIPYIGEITLKENDIEHLYTYIQEK